ncbi:class II fructose-bisphosphate aldolase [Tabrizicola sp. J26]|uniref:class II fructose-bisphosphate aldolase n=1 Tax=Alitabrizicola rongguiensis TaxID=2909234 RepID=UPI001F2D9099|nr:class II fructose-bisphosphate aldolase [Tabrizicola rongguiensis]MCF1708909.1 class II fructose-bisphosphate aldolase [Tabrizicola rongguiensis]
MTRATLKDVLTPCLTDRTAVAGLVVLGWEDAVAYVRAAEAASRPVILQAGPGARAHMPLPVFGAMFHALAQGASVPVVAHLDHGEDVAVCRQAIDCGFTSVMFDGSTLPLEHNIARTAEIAALARSCGVSVEAELGYVGYHGGAASMGTDPAEVALFARETGVDALAVSVGNNHLMTSAVAELDLGRLKAIEAAAPGLPLVLHGGSGIPIALRRRLAEETAVCKVNIGTELRMAFGVSLREALLRNPEEFDRIRILRETIEPVSDAARTAIESLCPSEMANGRSMPAP